MGKHKKKKHCKPKQEKDYYQNYNKDNHKSTNKGSHEDHQHHSSHGYSRRDSRNERQQNAANYSTYQDQTNYEHQQMYPEWEGNDSEQSDHFHRNVTHCKRGGHRDNSQSHSVQSTYHARGGHRGNPQSHSVQSSYHARGGYRGNPQSHSMQSAHHARGGYRGIPQSHSMQSAHHTHGGYRGYPQYQMSSANRGRRGSLLNSSYHDDDYEDENWIDDVELSKEIVRIVRHGKYKLIKMDSEGYVNVGHIIHDKKFINTCGDISFDRIWKIVHTNDKKRFELKHVGPDWFIKATQGHTVQVDNLNLTPITNPQDYPSIFHGTYFEAWEFIKEEGLNRMKRNHIHFAIGFPNDRRVVSGMRKSSELVIVLDLDKAMQAGLKFFVSSNGVVLTAGDEDGRIHPKFFRQVFQLKPYKAEIPFEVPPDFDPISDSSRVSDTVSGPSSCGDSQTDRSSVDYHKPLAHEKRLINRRTAEATTNTKATKRKAQDDYQPIGPNKFGKFDWSKVDGR